MKPKFESEKDDKETETEKDDKYVPIKKPHYEKSDRPSDRTSYKPRYDKPRYDKHDGPSSRPSSRPYSPTETKHEHQESFKPRYQPNITEAPTIKQTTHYQSPMPSHGANHTHPKNINPAFVDLRQTSLYPPAFVPEYSYMPNGMPFVNNLLKPNEIHYKKYIILILVDPVLVIQH